MKIHGWLKTNIIGSMLLVSIGVVLWMVSARFIPLFQSPQETVMDAVMDNGTRYALVHRKSGGPSPSGDYLTLSRQEKNGEWKTCYEKDFTGLRPWKLRMADMDGDARKELMIAVKKSTHYDPEVKNRLFIFRYEDGKLAKRWTGSQIAGFWRDFYVGDVVSIPGNELVFIEQVKGEGERLSIYYWHDFGFGLLAESGVYEEISSLAITGENRIEITVEGGRPKERRTMRIVDGKIREWREHP